MTGSAKITFPGISTMGFSVSKQKLCETIYKFADEEEKIHRIQQICEVDPCLKQIGTDIEH